MLFELYTYLTDKDPCIRLYKSNLNKDFYQMIETNIIELEHS